MKSSAKFYDQTLPFITPLTNSHRTYNYKIPTSCPFHVTQTSCVSAITLLLLLTEAAMAHQFLDAMAGIPAWYILLYIALMYTYTETSEERTLWGPAICPS